MLKISAVVLTTGLFAGLIVASPSITDTGAAAGSATAAVKVKTFAVHPTMVRTHVAAFQHEQTRFLRRPAYASRARNLRRA